jgi:hypothetical protein
VSNGAEILLYAGDAPNHVHLEAVIGWNQHRQGGKWGQNAPSLSATFL